MASKIIKKIISTTKAPKAIGPYSQAVQAGGFLYVSGQLGMNPETTELVEGGVEAQAEQALKNMGAILASAGCSFKNVVKVTLLLADMSDFNRVNAIYSKYFDEHVPARVAYQVSKLPKGGLVEIDAIAVTGDVETVSSTNCENLKI